MEEVNKIVEKEANTLLDKADIDAKVEVKEVDGNISVVVDTDENALLIGKHGNTLSSLELILSLIVAKKTGEYKRILIEVGGYREAREEYLRDLANRLKDEVVSTGIEKTVRGLKPWERRVVHMQLSESDEVVTESEGEDRDRVLVIKKK